MGIACIRCKSVVQEGIINFHIENALSFHEEILLMHCEKCDAFFQIYYIDNWFSDSNRYTARKVLYSEEQALKIFLAFASCRNYKDCECSSHEAIVNWVTLGNYDLFEQDNLFEELKENEKYDKWIKDWTGVITEDRKQLKSDWSTNFQVYIRKIRSLLFGFLIKE